MGETEELIRSMREKADLLNQWDGWELGQTPVPAKLSHHETAITINLAADRLAALEGEVRRLREALQKIAKQHLRSEMDDDPIEGVNADWEHGYECCVEVARSALSPERK
jgi:hypothetical protein